MHEKSNGLINVIVVTQKKGNYLSLCLDSISAQTYSNLTVSVIDNSQENLFYCQALNKGIAQGAAEFVLCLNDDVILEPAFIKEALKGFALNGNIGLVSGKILRTDRKTLDSTGLFLTYWRTAKERGYGNLDKGQFDKPQYIFGVNGAVAFYRRQMLEETKVNSEYFDHNFRIFYEDLDISWRAHRRGWKGYYVPLAVAYHVRGGTVRKERGINKKHARKYISDELYVDLIKNRYLTIIRNEAFISFILFSPFMLAYDLLAWIHILVSRPRLLKKIFFIISLLIPEFKKRLSRNVF